MGRDDGAAGAGFLCYRVWFKHDGEYGGKHTNGSGLFECGDGDNSEYQWFNVAGYSFPAHFAQTDPDDNGGLIEERCKNVRHVTDKFGFI